MRNKERFVPNSRACRRQLRLWTSGAVKLLLVTGCPRDKFPWSVDSRARAQ